jgi:hypothetical protein
VKRLGPELKMPKRSDLKVPPVLSDLYWDLRDRRLLPIVALLIVAVIAAPILLNRGSDSPGPTPAPAVGATGSTAKGAQLTVVEAQPGLRNPKKRFAHRKPTDPFKQRFTGPQVANAEANAVTTVTTTQGSPSSAGGGAGEEAPVVSSPEVPVGGGGESNESSSAVPSSPTAPKPPNGSTEQGGPGTGGEGGAKSEGGGSSHGSSPLPEGGSNELRYYLWTAKIQIAHTETDEGGSTQLGEPEVRESVKSLTPLPGSKKPVVTFIGVDPRTENGLFVVSKEVTAMYGEAKCISGTSTCEVVELETGFPETFEYGPEHVRWKLKVLATELVHVKKSAEN